MFRPSSDRLTDALRGLSRKGRLTEVDTNAAAREIRLILLETDVSLEVVHTFIGRTEKRANEIIDSQTVNPASQIIEVTNEELINILGGETRRLNLSKQPPAVIMLAGLQGTGKAASAGKLARYLTDRGHALVPVACDLQRLGAARQLEIVVKHAGVLYFAPFPGTSLDSTHETDTSEDNPVDATFHGLAYAHQHRRDVVIIDTAGRLGIDEVPTKQARDIRDTINPHEVLFVIDPMISQDAVGTAKVFRDDVDLTGAVLTKPDSDACGGAALFTREVTGKSILLASTGEKLEDFDAFHPNHTASRILDVNDLRTLVEVASKEIDHERAAKSAQRIDSGELTLEDFLEQMMMVRKMGPISSILKMLSGGTEMSKAAEMIDERQFNRVEAIIHGMTPEERKSSKILNASRRRHITNDSGVSVSEASQLIERFDEARKTMAQMAGRLGMGGDHPPSRKTERGRKGKGKNKRKGANHGPTPPKAIRGGGMPSMPGTSGVQGMPGMPSMAELQRLQK